MSSRPEPWRLELEIGGRRVLYQRQTGRHVVVPEGPLGPGWSLRLERLHLVEPAPIAQLYPQRSRLALLLPESRCLWMPLPLERRFAEVPLSEREIALWRAMTGARRVSELEDAEAFIHRLTAPELQALQLRDAPARGRDLGLERQLSPPRPPGARPADQHDPAGATSLGTYHQEIDAHRHFDERETTLAHAFARPHPALQGVRWGARLRESLGVDSGRVLEVGCGTGELARDFLGDAPLDYTCLDASPALLAAQARVAPTTTGVLGDAQAMPFEDASFDVVISNEVLADLQASRDPGEWPITLEPEQAWFNTGSFAFIREVARVLRPGGRAYLSEFGGPEESPRETVHLDHPEISIHFGQCAQVARGCGLEVELVRLDGLMGAELSQRWISRQCFAALKARFGLEARAWTIDRLELPEPVEGLWEVPIHEEGPGPVITRFWALLLRKPSPPDAA